MDREQLKQLVVQVKAERRTDLDLSLAWLTDDHVVHLMSDAEALVSVRLLSLRNNKAISDAAVREVAQRLPNLTFLNLAGCHQIAGAAVREVAQRLPNLAF